MSKENIYIVGHTHWDREWYRSANEFKVRAYNTIIDIIETLEEENDFSSFTLDGQYQMVEEALEVNPELESRILKLVSQRRLFVGPWYIQPDMNLVDGESIANNLRIGIAETDKRFHSHLKTLWNPDTFTQSPNTPFFVNEFGFNGVYAWRNFASDNLSNYKFTWSGLDGSDCKSIAFPLGYGYFRYLSKYVDENLKVQSGFIDDIKDKFSTQDILLMIGSDHATIDKNMPNKIKEMNNNSDLYSFKITNPEEYMNLSQPQSTEEFNAMPISFKGGRIHPGIGASRMDIKQYNIHQQIKIAKILNPILAITESVGGRNQEKIVDLIYKNLFKNQFHDSIYTSLPEKVNNEVFNRYVYNEQLIDETIYLCSRYIIKNSVIQSDECEEYGVIFNTLPYNYTTDVNVNIKSANEFIDINIDDRKIDYIYSSREVDYESKDYSGLKSLAGKYQVIPDSGVEFGEKFEHTIILKNVELPAMGYLIYKVSKNENYSPLILEKALELDKDVLVLPNGEKINLKNIVIENIEDEGDSYNFSTKSNSVDVTIDWELVNDILIGKGQYGNEQFFDLKMNYFDNKLNVSVELENKLENNQTSLVFKFDEDVETYTNMHYANIKNDYLDKYLTEEWKENEYKEKPLPIYLFSRYLEINKKYTITSNDVTQFYQKNNEIKFTLLRSFDKMGKLDLEYRPGRASGYVLDTPNSQQIKSFSYNFTLHFNALECLNVNKAIVKPTSRFIVPTINESTHTLSSTYSLFEIANENVLFETFYKKDKCGYVLRLSNPTTEEQKVKISDKFTVYNSNLSSEQLDAMSNLYIVKPNSAKTVIIK